MSECNRVAVIGVRCWKWVLFGILEDAFFPPGLRGNDTSVISNYFGMIVSCSVGYMDRAAFCICWVIGICLGGRYICFILVNVLFPRGEALISFVFFLFLLRDLRQCDQCVFMYGYGTSTVVVCFFAIYGRYSDSINMIARTILLANGAGYIMLQGWPGGRSMYHAKQISSVGAS